MFPISDETLAAVKEAENERWRQHQQEREQDALVSKLTSFVRFYRQLDTEVFVTELLTRFNVTKK